MSQDDTTDLSMAPDHKRQRKEPTEGNQPGSSKKAPLATSGKDTVDEPVPSTKGQGLSQTKESPSDAQGKAPSASYGSKAAGGMPLVVSFRGSDDPLGMEQVECVKEFLDRGIVTSDALDFTVRVDKVALQDRKVRISCGDRRTHAWVKALFNNEKDGDFVARSLDELPPMRKFWFRMYKRYDVSQTHVLLRRCNVNFPEGKLHIRSIIPDGNGKTIIVGAEPMMVKYLEEKKFFQYLTCYKS